MRKVRNIIIAIAVVASFCYASSLDFEDQMITEIQNKGVYTEIVDRLGSTASNSEIISYYKENYK